jgi:hypothetical protein
MSSKEGYLTQEEYAKQQTVDQTLLITDLSHQLEEARTRMETLETANRQWAEKSMRAEAARDAIKELLLELWKGKP